MATRKERTFQKKVKALIEKAHNMEDDAVKRVIRLLANARKEVAATVASTEWQAYYLPEMKRAIEDALRAFGDQYGIELRTAQRTFWEHGIDMVDLPLKTVGIAQAIPQIDHTVLSIMQDFSADLVEGLTKSAISKINNELTLGLMGQKSPYEVMGAIGRNLKQKSIFKNIADRAEAITRTEAGRVLSAASQARQEKAAQVVPGLQKEWRHSHIAKMPRAAHLAVEGQIRDVDKPFDVAGEKLMYPRDPAGSAKNTIRCECYSVPYHSDWGAVSERLAA
jgi:hypothetical protein